jgi:predicted ArsR family transcriptional regulator
MSVLADYLVDPEISFLDRVKIQAQVLVPVLRALRAELGKEKADAIVRQALRDWSKQLFAAIGASVEGSPRRKWATLRSALDEVTAQEVDFEILRQDGQALDIDVTHCRFAAFFQSIGEPELGALLICQTDLDITIPSEGAVTLERAQTIMQGAPTCTFRYTFARREG